MFYKPITILCLLCCLLLNLHAYATKDLVATSATESKRAMDHQRGINFLQNEDDHSTYSQNFGNAVARYYGYALGSYGSGYGSAKINNPSNINQNYYTSNNREFSRLDKQKGANHPALRIAEPIFRAGSKYISQAAGLLSGLFIVKKANEDKEEASKVPERPEFTLETKHSEEKQQSQDSNQNAGQNNQAQAPAPAPLPPEDDDDKEVNKLKVGKDNIGQYKHGGFGNKRILNDGEVKIGQNKNISLDVESGGSGKVNIHMKVDGKKYFYDENSKLFIDTNGKKLSSKITKNEKIQTAIQKALDYANKIKGVE